ncbi:MAG TPA: Rad52/Rad22 family DNA repair protein [Gemmatimonadaceae bacterium]|nr:Rad52/Rad22 family DNA repair protein [Gemmatimonadaceae bacterium]
MIARQDAYTEKNDVWAKLSAPVPTGAISWRQDGKVTARDGKYFARFVAYIEANTVRERLDATVPGEWDLTLELLPPIPADDGDGSQCSFKARLQILGVIREDVGTGRDYKQASTDAFKRAAVRFGVANELYAYEQNWVEMDGDGKYAKPVEDPQAAYDRRYARLPNAAGVSAQASAASLTASASMLTDLEIVSCPKCGGRMWDNRLTKRNPRAPDYKCQNRSCDGVIWPAKAATPPTEVKDQRESAATESVLVGGEEELPF